MPSVNHVLLVGRLTRDPQRNGPALKFSLAVDRFGKDKGADFIDCVAFERLSETIEPMLAKGRQVAVEGRLKHHTWEAEGGKRSKIEVVAFNIQLIDRPKQEESEESESAEDVPEGGGDGGDNW